MRVVVHPADIGGCGYYRLIWPGEALQTQGHDVAVEFDKTYQCVWQDTLQGPTVVGLAQDIDADVIVVQRPFTRNRYEMVGVLQEAGYAVVVEIDDDFHAIHLRNAAWKWANPLTDPEHNRDWLMRSCLRADLVTVTTQALAARYGPHGRVAVIPNCVPARYLDCAGGAYTAKFLPRPDGVLVGWSGSVLTHPGDLDQLGDTITRLATDGYGFHVIGTGVKVADVLGLPEPVSATGWLPIEAYPEAVAQLDVGVVPLLPSPFNEAKSALKGLEMAAVGVPFVASPAADYVRLAEDGIGWLADTPTDWYEKISLLVTDDRLRSGLAEQWQDSVRERWTIEGNAWRWMQAWEQAQVNVCLRRAA